MNAIVRKEIRQLLPAWGVAMVLAVFPVWLIPLRIGHDDTSQVVIFGIFCLGVLLLSMVPFGAEFSGATFSQLLAQPVPRLRLWQVKMRLFVPAAVMVVVAFIVSFRLRIAGDVIFERVFLRQAVLFVVTAAMFFAGGLWTNLLFRQVMAAFWLTILIPVIVFYGTAALLTWLTPLTLPLPPWLLLSQVALYFIGSWFWARRMFLRAQDVPWSGWTMALPVRFGRKSREVSRARRIRGPISAIVWKEIQFQYVGLMLGTVIVVLHFALIILRVVHPAAAPLNKFTLVLSAIGIIFWFTLPILAGSQSVAEERKLGTLEGSLCLPVTRRRQFAIKLFVVIAVSVLFCAVVPWLIEGTAVRVGFPGRPSPIDVPFHLEDLGRCSAFIAIVAALAVYGSTLTRNTMQAICATLVIEFVAAIVTLFMNDPFPLFPGYQGGFGLLSRAIGIPVLLVLLLWLAFGNYRRVLVDSRVWFRNGLVAVATIFAVFASALLVHVRAWEWLMTLEPPHGPAVMTTGTVKPRVRIAGEKYFVLLPDGRIWVSGDFDRRFLFNLVQGHQVIPFDAAIPLNGRFMTESNWTALENHFGYPVVAMRSDGSLWQFLPSNRTIRHDANLQRVGNDSDWKTIASGPGFGLAIKTNGTLWGWGQNRGGQLGPGPSMVTNGPVQIGKDSDWNAVFATPGTSIGVKHDGSAWKWGQLNVGPFRNRYDTKDTTHPDPVRWNVDGSQWIRCTGDGGLYDFVLSQDGTAWTSLSQDELPGVLSGDELWNGLARVGEKSQWADVDVVGGELTALTKDGSLLHRSLRAASRFERILYGTTSEHSDWIAAASNGYTESAVALAADGTLSCWYVPRTITPEKMAWLGPTRKPLWTLDIFQAAQHP